jgi:alpha-tubulin suppressor-like RCC1 family protein
VANAVDLSVGFASACALLADSTVRCWGANAYGQLGDGTFVDRTTAVTVLGLAGVAQVSHGGTTACAVMTLGGVQCWGHGMNGELGNGSLMISPVPVGVTGITNAAEVSVAASSCAPRVRVRVGCQPPGRGRRRTTIGERTRSRSWG